jgi:hypothetical protein
VVGGALSLVALWPMLMPLGVLEIAYPASLEGGVLRLRGDAVKHRSPAGLDAR